jgi:gamma-glutamylcyclotransferase (GGCT)/AIG2-like uncharacterized protein YtfP
MVKSGKVPTALEEALTLLVEKDRKVTSLGTQLLGATRRLIVYGSLIPGGSNHDQIASIKGTWQQGWVSGELVQLGWGSEIGYPALRWDPQGSQIPAFLLDSPELPIRWPQLDRFEGEEYRRILIPFHVDEEEWVVGQVYADNQQPLARRL